jgi:hypothetical protein
MKQGIGKAEVEFLASDKLAESKMSKRPKRRKKSIRK